jgi:hypothetical protein
MPTLLPKTFDTDIAAAVAAFWSTRTSHRVGTQGGTRGSVIAGKNMEGFEQLVGLVASHCGLPEDCVFTRKRDQVLPGYFRPTKNWDVLVIHEGQLLAAFEFKSQVGSFGNNFNNRSEEVIGSAADLWVAHRYGGFAPQSRREHVDVVAEPDGQPVLTRYFQSDPRPPFLAWVMLVEDCDRSRKPVGVTEPHYPVFPEFKGASYVDRYRILCERLMSRRLYSGAGLVLSSKETGPSGEHTALTPGTSVRAVFRDFAGRLVAHLDQA